MFNNLIESASHSSEMKRRSSFFLGALGGYSLLFMAIGVASVFAYDANLDKQNLELISLISPTDYIRETPQPVKQQAHSAVGDSSAPHVAMRTSPPPSNDPTKTEVGVHSVSNQPPPLYSGEKYVIGTVNLPAGIGLARGGTSSGNGGDNLGFNGTKDLDPPPPVKHIEPKTEKKTTVISKGVITGLATNLPKPHYTPLAVAAGAQGTVSVQILIDEKGNVISAKAVSGNPLLTAEAVRAAYLAKFSPTYLSDVPVKVSGIINYDFQRH